MPDLKKPEQSEILASSLAIPPIRQILLAMEDVVNGGSMVQLREIVALSFPRNTAAAAVEHMDKLDRLLKVAEAVRLIGVYTHATILS
jgi:hypothetical protein